MFFLVAILAIAQHGGDKTKALHRVIEERCKVKGDFTKTSQRVSGSPCPGIILIQNSTFSNIIYTGSWLFAPYQGGAIFFNSFPEVIMLGNTIKQVSADDSGGAAYFEKVSTITSIENHFINCESKNNGGDMFITGSNTIVDIKSNEFTGSKGNTMGGSLYIEKSSKVHIIGSTITNSNVKDAMGNGGSFYFSTITEVHINQSAFVNPECSFGSGGACYCSSLSDLILFDNNFFNCTAQLSGGTIYLEKSLTSIMIQNSFNECRIIEGTTIKKRYGAVLYVGSTTPVTLKDNSFKDCYGYFGGSVFFNISDGLELISNNFTNCTVRNDYGGAVSIRNQNGVTFRNNIFISCHCSLFGGAIYLERISSTYKSISFQGDAIEECFSSYYGVISLVAVDKISLDSIQCSKCNSSLGGVLYIEKTLNSVDIKNSIFENCKATSDGGAIYFALSMMKPVYLISATIVNNSFNNCIAVSGIGGAIDIVGNVINLELRNSRFKSCKSFSYGSAIYFNSYVRNPEKVVIMSSSNVFEDCESEKNSTFTIKSVKIDHGTFENDSFRNCKAISADGYGGAFMANIENYSTFSFTRCNFAGCSAGDKYGAIGFVFNNMLSNENSSINFYGCLFDNCSANEAACIGTEQKKKGLLALKIESYEEQLSTFKSMSNEKGKYAILSEATTFSIKQTRFENVNIGPISCSGTNANLADCNFINCESLTGIVNFTSLSTLVIDHLTFNHCENCFQIKCSGLSMIKSLSLNNLESSKKIASVIESNVVQMTDFILTENNEPIIIKVNALLEIESGRFEKNNELISIIGEGSPGSVFHANNLNAQNSLMFSIDKIGNTTISDCNIIFDSSENKYSKSIITVSSFSNNVISKCNFSTNKISPIDFSTESKNSNLLNCIFNGNEAHIMVHSPIKVRNCDFNSKDASFEIIGTDGRIMLDSNTNCFRNRHFQESFVNGEGKVFDFDGKEINNFNDENNHCNEYYPSAEFTKSLEFENSLEFTKSHEFSSSKSFEPTNTFKINPTPSPSQSAIPKEEPKEEPTSIPKHEENPTSIYRSSSVLVRKTKLPTQSKVIRQPLPTKKQIEDEMNSPTQEQKEFDKRERITTSLPPDPTNSPKIIYTSEEKHKDSVSEPIPNMPVDEEEPEANVGNQGFVFSTGMIAGAAAGGFVVILIIIIIIIYVAVCRKRTLHALSSFDDIETELETLEGETPMIPSDFRTAYVTQEMIKSQWTNADPSLENDIDFINQDESDQFSN